MTDRFESELRHALRPVEPSADFTERVLARLPHNASSNVTELRSRASCERSRERVWRWLPIAAAAAIVAAVLVRHELQLHDEIERGRLAREQLIEALRVTSAKLDVAYQAVRSQSAVDSQTQTKPTTDDTSI